MGYTEKLSEQLVMGDHVPYSVMTTATRTGSAVDMLGYQRAIAYGYGGQTIATFSIALQASTATTFGTPTTLASATSTANSCVITLSVDGEDVQSARAAEDRYIRAVITHTGAGGGGALVLLDAQRHKH